MGKPCRAPMEPPGGSSTTEKRASACGKKLFPDMGAGNNRDAHAVEALRYYQDESERLGKHSVPQQDPLATKDARDSHRYYLAAEGKADLAVGKSRNQQRRDSEQSTEPGSSDVQQSEYDDLPLGAEFTSMFTRCR